MNVYKEVHIQKYTNSTRALYSSSLSSSSSSSSSSSTFSKKAMKWKVETTNGKTVLISKMTCSNSDLKLYYYFLPSFLPGRVGQKNAINFLTFEDLYSNLWSRCIHGISSFYLICIFTRLSSRALSPGECLSAHTSSPFK